jgi:uncharacterized membrane protein
MSDQIYLTILRLLHIFGGIFWAGAAIYMSAFVGPAINASGTEGSKVMQQLAKTNRLPLFMFLSSTITVVAGILLLWKLSNGFQSAWMSTLHGKILSMGGGLAIIAYFIGFFVNRPAAEQIKNISIAIAKQGSAPSQAQMEILMKMKRRLFKGGTYISILLSLTIIAMSIFRYL